MYPARALLIVTLLFPTSVCLAQGTILNPAQSKLLDLEEEAKTFITFQADLAGLQIIRLTRALTQSELLPVQAKAKSLLPLATKLHSEALALSGQLYLEPGVELDVDTMYRSSAWDLHVYYVEWMLILNRVISASTTSPIDTWGTKELGSWFDDARTYRILANQQYEIDHLGH